MRADRLIALALLLQARGRMTADELAERLEVSVRTIYRDLDALGLAGVPVYADRGPGGGFSLPDGYSVDLTALNSREASALFLSATPGRLADLGVGAVLEAALRKLSAALPADTRRQAERARERVLVDSAGWWGGAEPVPHLRTIQEAVSRDRRLMVEYTRPNGQAVTRLVDPLGLVVKVSVWYLVARLADDEPEGTRARTGASERELRVFRVSRLREVTPTDVRAERPADFDLPTFWSEWSAHFASTLPRYLVTLRVAPEFLPELRRRLWHVGQSGVPSDEAELERGADGWVTLPAVDLEHFDEALGSVLSAGSSVEVVAPAELRRAVAEQTAALAARYAADGELPT